MSVFIENINAVGRRLVGGHLFLSKLWQLTKPYFSAEERQLIRFFGLSFTIKESWIARGLIALVIALSVVIVFFAKLLNDWNARFYNALQEKNADAFWHELNYWIWLVALYIVVAVYRLWLRQLVVIRWRRWLSEVYFRDWLADRIYYRMELVNTGTDNPEQRIEQDCASFANQTIAMTLGLLSEIMTLVTFAVVLWGLSGNFVLPIFGGISIPGYMMWAALLYAIAGSWLTYVIGRPLVRVNFELERYNANFRYRLIRIRENAESIALYRGEPEEERRLRDAFTRIYDTWWNYMKYNKRLTWLTGFYGQAASVFPVVVAAPNYFAGKVGLGVLTQTAGAFGQVQGSLSWFVDSYAQLAEWKAVLDRLSGFREAMDNEKRKARTERTFEYEPHAAHELVLKNVDVKLPNGELLVQFPNLKLSQGESVLLRGPSGSGKTTLFRVFSGLWPFGTGRVQMPGDARTLFLPQKPYLPIGTLKEALSYPATPDHYDDKTCEEVLAACLLKHLIARLHQRDNWSLSLSGGEQQRLAFARALLYRPNWLFLDEASSALDEATEERMYRLVNERLRGATILSIAHNPKVFKHHNRVLTVDPAHHSVSAVPIAAS
jgi:putative ATP-binding cassette transporter